MKRTSAIKFLIAFLILFSTAEAQTGGNFTIMQSIVAGGGQNSAGGMFSVCGGSLSTNNAGTMALRAVACP